MRRKSLAVTIGLVLILALLHCAGIPLAHSVLESWAEPQTQEPVSLYGKITGLKMREKGGCRLEVQVEKVNERKLHATEKVLVTCTTMEESPEALFRRKIRIRGVLQLPETRRNPGCFDYRLYLKTRGIFYEMRAESFQIEEDRGSVTDQLAAWLIGKRFAFRETLDPRFRGLISGVLFGDTSDMEDQVYEEFRRNGTSHVLAVSGLHLGILYGMYLKIVEKRKKPGALILLVGAIAAYGTVSMWSPSVERASAMILLAVAAHFLDLRYDMLSALSGIALFLILGNPYVIFSAGFQMSFLAIASICFFSPLLPRKVPDWATAMLSVQFGLALYQMYAFNYISLSALAANLPVVFLTGMLVPCALLAFLLFILSGSGFLLMKVTDSLCYLLLTVNRLSSVGGKGGFDVVSPPLWLVVGGYLLLFFCASETCLILRERRKKWTLCILVLLCLLLGFCCEGISACPAAEADLMFVDVGQGDCLHIRDGEKNVLIDGGGKVGYNVGEKVLKPYLLKNGTGHVDLAIATHLHTDHYQGLLELSEVYPVRRMESGLTAGTKIRVSDRVVIETLWPLEINPQEGQDENRQCSVFLIHYDKARILVTGDLDEEGEKAMVEYYRKKGKLQDLRADILKVGHHGSKTSTCDEFLDAVQPEIAVIQVGVYNIYGHPNRKILEKLQQKGIMIRRTDYNGGIGFYFYEDGFRVETVLS